MDKSKLILDGSKILYHKERLSKWLLGEKIAPIVIECAITTNCNYKCVFCSKKFQKIEELTCLSKQDIFNFLDDVAEIGVKAISFIGDGENTCNPHLKEAIVYGRGKGLDIALGTNGYLLKEAELEDILPCLTYIRFSICAAEKNRYSEIHGCADTAFAQVVKVIKKSVELKKQKNLSVTIGLQMVLMPEFSDQIIPLSQLGRELGVDYLVIKHCSDDEEGSIGVNYDAYKGLVETLKRAEEYSTDTYQVTAKWSKILTGKDRVYSKCYGAPFMIQMSGSGLLAPCGPFFNEKYKKFHLGNIKETRFRDIWNDDNYWNVMKALAAGELNPQMECPYLCLQHNTNNTLWNIKENNANIAVDDSKQIQHINFV